MPIGRIVSFRVGRIRPPLRVSLSAIDVSAVALQPLDNPTPDAVGARICGPTHTAAELHPARHANRTRDPAEYDAAREQMRRVVDAYAVTLRRAETAPEAMVIAVKAATMRGLRECRDREIQVDLVHEAVRWAAKAYYRDADDGGSTGPLPTGEPRTDG